MSGITLIDDLGIDTNIRNDRGYYGGLPSESGMNINTAPSFQQGGNNSYNHTGYGGYSYMNSNDQSPVEQIISITPSKKECTCVEIFEHIQSCELCSKFYKNDNTYYVASIIALLVICVFLLKKVLKL